MQIFVKTMSAKTIIVDVEANDTIDSVKAKIAAREGIKSSKQRLTYAGRELENRRTLADYDIKKESTLQLLPRISGGGNIEPFFTIFSRMYNLEKMDK
ncbi:Ubiquitin-60S ribosomal protein L40 [Zostera marina]|uniref:Ubiquitin-60S ribosomal protein L40 n=1 Tax=Zostera marina TaxID=29655 RepID=A0A0K9PTP2_ZOSMR|nr:Ubiquitin-60S ribosomal protein L40 [Zostera marina]